jgi:hypothetical protein
MNDSSAPIKDIERYAPCSAKQTSPYIRQVIIHGFGQEAMMFSMAYYVRLT